MQGSRHDAQKIIAAAIKLNIIKYSDLNDIQKIHKMRNVSAHLDVATTKVEATNAINYVKQIIKGDSSDNI